MATLIWMVYWRTWRSAQPLFAAKETDDVKKKTSPFWLLWIGVPLLLRGVGELHGPPAVIVLLGMPIRGAPSKVACNSRKSLAAP